MRQCYEGRHVSTVNFRLFRAAELTALTDFCLHGTNPWQMSELPCGPHHPPGCSLVGASEPVQCPASSKLQQCVLSQAEWPLPGPSLSLGDSLLCLGISASKAVTVRVAGLSSGGGGTERLPSTGKGWGFCLKWTQLWFYWKGWTQHPCLVIDCKSLMEAKIVKSIKMCSECKPINENYSYTGY